MFVKEKLEKDHKIKELQVLKNEIGPIPEASSLKTTVEQQDLSLKKEKSQRIDKEQKLEEVNSELQKTNKSLNDLYEQFDQLYDKVANQEE